MKATGIVRPVDALGRVVIPVELRRNLGIKTEDSLEIFVDGQYIMLKKYEPSCIFCGEMDDVKMIHGKTVCGKCIEEYAEYNVVCDAVASQNVADNWPTPKSYLGWEAGLMETGECLTTAPADHPVRMAYELWNNGRQCKRCSWDPMTVLYAIEEDSPLVRNSRPGTVRFTPEGYTVFTAEDNGPDHYAELTADDETIVNHINGLLLKGI
jgi:transcriptional pleiotropic regulator of transition state genes